MKDTYNDDLKKAQTELGSFNKREEAIFAYGYGYNLNLIAEDTIKESKKLRRDLTNIPAWIRIIAPLFLGAGLAFLIGGIYLMMWAMRLCG